MATKKQQEDAGNDTPAFSEQDNQVETTVAIQEATNKLVEASQQLEASIKALNQATAELSEARTKLTEAKQELQATKETLEQANATLSSANEKLTQAHIDFSLALTENEEVETDKAKPVSSISMKTAQKSAIELPEQAVEVSYKENGKEKKGKFKLLVPTLNIEGKTMTATECLEDAESMTYLVEQTIRNGKSPFVQQVFE